LSRRTARKASISPSEGEERTKSLKGSECLQKLRRNNVLICAAKLRVKEFAERNEAKVEAFGTLEILPRQEESAQEAQEEQRQPSDRQENRSGPLVYKSRRSSRRSLQKGGDRQPSDLI
jgi:hypothetical protein